MSQIGECIPGRFFGPLTDFEPYFFSTPFFSSQADREDTGEVQDSAQIFYRASEKPRKGPRSASEERRDELIWIKGLKVIHLFPHSDELHR